MRKTQAYSSVLDALRSNSLYVAVYECRKTYRASVIKTSNNAYILNNSNSVYPVTLFVMLFSCDVQIQQIVISIRAVNAWFRRYDVNSHVGCWASTAEIVDRQIPWNFEFPVVSERATYNKKHVILLCNTTSRKQELTFNEHRLSRTRSLAKQTNDLPPLCWKAAYMFCLWSGCAPICHLLGSWTRKCRRLKKTPSGGLLQDSAWGTLMNIILYNCRIHEMHCSPFEQVQNAFLILWIYIHVLVCTFDPLVIKMLWLVFHVKNVVKRKDVLFLQPMLTWIKDHSLLCTL